jgi:hypothetical protein
MGILCPVTVAIIDSSFSPIRSLVSPEPIKDELGNMTKKRGLKVLHPAVAQNSDQSKVFQGSLLEVQASLGQ